MKDQQKSQNVRLKAQKSNLDQRVFFAILERAGAMGKYQLFLIFAVSIINYLLGGLSLIMPYLFFQDPYQCSSTPSEIDCHEYVCGLPHQQRTAFIPDASIDSISNLFGDFRCRKEKLYLDWFISLMIAGKLLGFIAVAALGNSFGKKNLISSGLAACIFGILIALLRISIGTVCFGLFLMMGGIQISMVLSFTFLAQKVSEEYRSRAMVFVQGVFGAGALLNVLWFYLFRSWIVCLLYFYLFPAFLALIGIILYLVDSPFSLITKYTPRQACQAFHYIAKLNKTPQFQLEQTQVQLIRERYQNKLEAESKTRKQSFSPLDLLRYESLRMLTVCMIFVRICINIQFYGPALIIDQFQLSIFINGLVLGISQFLTYPFSYLIIDKPRKKIAYACFGVTAVTSFLLVFVWKQGEKQIQTNMWGNVSMLALLFVHRFAIAIEFSIAIIYVNQLYPTQIRTIGYSITSFSGVASTIFIPQLADLCIQNSISIMGCFSIFSVISISVSSFLPETLDIPPPDLIKQLRGKQNMIQLQMDTINQALLRRPGNQENKND